MTDLMTIRPAQERDIPRIMTLLEQVNLVHHAGRPDLFKAATKYSPDELRAILRDPDTPVFVAADAEDSVRGYVFCVFQRHVNERMLADIRTLYIDDLCVDELCRGQGIGSALYAFARDCARHSGCHNLTLNVWALNEGARKFYESLGMKVQKTGMEEIL